MSYHPTDQFQGSAGALSRFLLQTDNGNEPTARHCRGGGGGYDSDAY